MGLRTPVDSLALGIDPGHAGDHGFSGTYLSHISWRSKRMPAALELNPRHLFDRLFRAGKRRVPDWSGRLEQASQIRATDPVQASVLDLVREDTRSLQRQLGFADRRRLEDYLEGLRSIEKRIDVADRDGHSHHQDAFDEDPSNLALHEGESPDDLPELVFPSGSGIPSVYGDHVNLMLDIYTLALQTDTTRVGTFMFSYEKSGRSYPQIDAPGSHHSTSHHQGNPKNHDELTNINTHHMELFARMLGRMAAIEEGDSTLLDNVALLYGSGISDGNKHNHDDLPILVAGGGGGRIRGGRHVNFQHQRRFAMFISTCFVPRVWRKMNSVTAPVLPKNCRDMKRTLVGAGLLALALWGSATASAQPGMDKDPLSFDRQIRPLLHRYCYRCHNESESNGDVDLQQDENPNLILRHRTIWATALEMIRSEQMPPDDSPQPRDEDRERMIEYLSKKLSEFDCDSISDPGTPTARRLTRLQYNHAVAELTGLQLSVADQFSPDPTGYGFAGIGDAMGLSPVLVQQYEQAASDIAAALIDSRQSNPDVFRRVFGDPGETDSASARPAVEAFAARAFRRPVAEPLVDALMHVYDIARQNHNSHVDALGHVFRAILMSPRFFMRIETPSTETPAETAYLVDDYDLASRLSFFLWSSPPDDALLVAAKRGQLNDPHVLVEQTHRMLADPRVEEGLVKEFFAQWLQLNQIETHQVSDEVFPEFDRELRESMRNEAYALLSNMIREDRPLTDLVDTDFTFLDARLAQHYAIASVQGNQLRRVLLQDRRRGGLLTTAALLMLQSDPGRTNVPRRGNFVAGVFLGTPPPPPPPDVPPLQEVAGDGKPRPLRELLEEHRRRPQCAACHAKMDPLGFALENYDAVGRWRENDAGQPIDASGHLASGESFDGPAELKDVLLSRQDDLTRALTEKLVIYALGRGLRPGDECTIRDAVAAARANNYRFSSLVTVIVRSFSFRYRMDPPF